MTRWILAAVVLTGAMVGACDQPNEQDTKQRSDAANVGVTGTSQEQATAGARTQQVAQQAIGSDAIRATAQAKQGGLQGFEQGNPDTGALQMAMTTDENGGSLSMNTNRPVNVYLQQTSFSSGSSTTPTASGGAATSGGQTLSQVPSQTGTQSPKLESTAGLSTALGGQNANANAQATARGEGTQANPTDQKAKLDVTSTPPVGTGAATTTVKPPPASAPSTPPASAGPADAGTNSTAGG